MPRELRDCKVFLDRNVGPFRSFFKAKADEGLLGGIANKLDAAVTHIVLSISDAARGDAAARGRIYATLQSLQNQAPDAQLVTSDWLRRALLEKRLLPLGEADLVTLASLAPAAAAPAAPAAAAAAAGPQRAWQRKGYACQKLSSLEAQLSAIRDSTEDVSRIFHALYLAYAVRGKHGQGGESDYFKGRAFNYASRRVRQLGFPINTWDDAERARVALGWDRKSSCFETLQEILENISRPTDEDRCARLKMLNSDEIVVNTRELRKVHGIGPAEATNLFLKHGINSVAALRERLAQDALPGVLEHEKLKLKRAILVGLEYFEDMQQRIPRAELEAIVNIVRAYAEKLAPGVCVQAVGSYRRGANDSGDVDILLTHPDDEIGQDLKNLLLKALMDEALISAELAGGFESRADDHPDPQEKDGCGAWSMAFMGFFRLPEHLAPPEWARPLLHRRIDIKVYAKVLEPYALLYFTGSERFNRSMRHWAKQRKQSLSDRGLVPCFSTKAGAPHALYSSSVPAETEEDVFRALELEYVAPEDRNNVERA